jgi:hypothetical protein
MDQDIKKRWTDALRSGSYGQTQNWLRDSTGYCCLGVLCEIAVQDGVVVQEDGSYFDPYDPEDFSAEELPQAVIKWASLEDTDFSENPLSDVRYTGSVVRPPGREFAHLSELNDDLGYDFKRIADVIDRSL